MVTGKEEYYEAMLYKQVAKELRIIKFGIMENTKKPVQKKRRTKRNTKSSSVIVDVIIDTREQKGWDFTDKFPSNFSVGKTYIDTLPAGDYAMVGYDMPNDCYGVLMKGKRI